MDAFAKRHFPIDGQSFLGRSGTWTCEINGSVDVSQPDRKIFYLHFDLTQSDPRWSGPIVPRRKLELRTSLVSFTFDPSYPDWLRLVIEGFLDSDEIDAMREAYEVQRAPQPQP
jgi:hypothetical protein